MVYGEGGINETNTIHQIGMLMCPRCRNFHNNLLFEPMELVKDLIYKPDVFTHVGMCPNNELPIFLVYDGTKATLG